MGFLPRQPADRRAVHRTIRQRPFTCELPTRCLAVDEEALRDELLPVSGTIARRQTHLDAAVLRTEQRGLPSHAIRFPDRLQQLYAAIDDQFRPQLFQIDVDIRHPQRQGLRIIEQPLYAASVRKRAAQLRRCAVDAKTDALTALMTAMIRPHQLQPLCIALCPQRNGPAQR